MAGLYSYRNNLILLFILFSLVNRMVFAACTLPTISSQPAPGSAVICVNAWSAGYTVGISSDCIGGTITYQWQYSANGTSGWTNVVNNTPAGVTYLNGNASGAAPYYTSPAFQMSATTGWVYYYRCNVTCSCVGGKATSSNVTVTVAPILNLSSSSGSVETCLGVAIINIKYSDNSTGTGASATGFPAGVTGNYNAGTGIYTISGTPTGAGGTYTYTVTGTGPCGSTTATGTITVDTCLQGDSCTLAYAVPTNGTTITGSTFGAINTVGSVYNYTGSGCSGSSGSSKGQDVWYTFTTPATIACGGFNLIRGTITGDIEVSIYSGSCSGSLTPVGNADRCLCLYGSRCDFSSNEFTSNWTANTTYYIRVNNDSTQGTFKLCVNLNAVSAANDSCQGATDLSIGSTAYALVNAGCNYTSSASDPFCAGGGVTAWYRITPSASGPASFALKNVSCNNGGGGYSVCTYTGTCGSLTQLNGSVMGINTCGTATSGTVSWTATAGTTYYVMVTELAGSGAVGSNCTFTATTTTSSPTPIELLYFDAKRKSDGQVLLTWATASEINNDHFTILRSPDAQSFDEVANLPGAGNSTREIEYSYTDDSPYREVLSYYMLRQTDYDGHFADSKLVPVLPVGNNQFEIAYIMPDHNQGILYYGVRGVSLPAQPLNMDIIDMTGRKVYAALLTALQGTIPMSSINRGAYIVRISSGDQAARAKFIY